MPVETIEQTDDTFTPTRPAPKFPGASGLLAAGFALAVGELLSALLVDDSSLIVAVGNAVIDFSPAWLEDFAISTFGTYDKLALIIGILVLSGSFGLWIGRVAIKRFWVGAAALAGFGVVGLLAAGRDPAWTWSEAVVASGLSAGAGIAALRLLLRSGPGMVTYGSELAAADASRRRFFRLAGAVAGMAVLSLAGARWVASRAKRVVARTREEVVLPAAAETVTPAPPGLDVEGISPLVVPNDEFYRIDTALFVPRIDPADWSLSVTGMVDDPFTMGFDELLDLPMVERYITLSCVSNEVGGDLVGNARWLGVPLADFLDRAGVQEGATQIVGRSTDGFTVGFPTAVARDGREALVAVGMNGEPLPFDHGFPARLVVAGLYGYVSATKWLTEIELTTLEDFDAYWIPRGWAKEAPIKTQSRIDVPRRGSQLTTGAKAIAGVAWAPDRGIGRVEVSIDEGLWEEADLLAPLGDDAWVQWRYTWEAVPGAHFIRVRATDGAGDTQTEDRMPPRPDGATGYHTIRVNVVDA